MLVLELKIMMRGTHSCSAISFTIIRWMPSMPGCLFISLVGAGIDLECCECFCSLILVHDFVNALKNCSFSTAMASWLLFVSEPSCLRSCPTPTLVSVLFLTCFQIPVLFFLHSLASLRSFFWCHAGQCFCS